MTNTDTQNSNKLTVRIIIGFLAAIGVIYFLVTYIVDQRISELELETKLLISEQSAQLATIAEITARYGADDVTERIIKDCPIGERDQFDQLLARLDQGLSRAELTELDRLFGRCGNFFAERKSVMVARLEREIQIYETFVTQLGNLTGDDVTEYQVEAWENLVALEMKQSELFSTLVAYQDQIITLLLEGSTLGSEEFSEILTAVNETQESLIVTESQTSTIRSGLVSI